MFDTERLVEIGGLLLLLLAVYGQTGLFFCFFLPSGGLLFMSGVFIATNHFEHNLFTVCVLAILASLLGNMTGYGIGYKAGSVLYRREDSRFFKKRYLTAAQDFYMRHGAIAVSVGLFLPLIRTFGPIVAGVIKLRFIRFMLFAFIGSTAWVVSSTAAGYLIGSMPFLQPYLKFIIAGIIFLVTVPVVFKIVREFRKNNKSA